MACGAPVAVAASSSLPEVVGDAAVLFKPRDTGSIAEAMERVLGTSAFADALSKKSLMRAALFRPDKVVPRLVGVLEKAAESGG